MPGPMSRLVLTVFRAAVQPTYWSSSVKHASIWETMLRTLDLAAASWPFERCVRKAGIAIAARIPMIRITTSSSIRVKPRSSLSVRVETFRVMGVRGFRREPEVLDDEEGGRGRPAPASRVVAWLLTTSSPPVAAARPWGCRCARPPSRTRA